MTEQASVTTATTNQELAQQRSSTIRALTMLCLLAFPSLYIFFQHTHDWSVAKTGIVTILVVVAFRAPLDGLMRKILPSPSLRCRGLQRSGR